MHRKPLFARGRDRVRAPDPHATLFGHNRHRCGLFGDGELARLLDRVRPCAVIEAARGGRSVGAELPPPGRRGEALLRAVVAGQTAIIAHGIGDADLRFEAMLDEMRRDLAVRAGGRIRVTVGARRVWPGGAAAEIATGGFGAALGQVRGAAHVVCAGDRGATDTAARSYDLVAGAGLDLGANACTRIAARADITVVLLIRTSSRRLARARARARFDMHMQRIAAALRTAGARVRAGLDPMRGDSVGMGNGGQGADRADAAGPRVTISWPKGVSAAHGASSRGCNRTADFA